MPPSPSPARERPAPAGQVAALRALTERWSATELGERQAFQTWFHEFCEALGAERPSSTGATLRLHFGYCGLAVTNAIYTGVHRPALQVVEFLLFAKGSR
jgi:hypothetical protein